MLRQLFLGVSIYGVVTSLCQSFAVVELSEVYGEYVKVSLSRLRARSVGSLFGSMESIKQRFHLVDYSVSETSLE